MAIKLTERIVYTTRPSTHKVHRVNSSMYFTKSFLLPNEAKSDFEEVAITDIQQDDEELEA